MSTQSLDSLLQEYLKKGHQENKEFEGTSYLSLFPVEQNNSFLHERNVIWKLLLLSFEQNQFVYDFIP